VLPPPVHAALEIAAYSLAGLVYWRAGNAATQPPQRQTRWGLLAGAALGAALGARGLYVLQYWQALQGQPLGVWLGGKTIVGGMLGAVAGVEAAKALLGWRQSTGDGFVLPLIVAIVVGRIGCQLSDLSDLTYGNVTSLPWGWDYGDGLSRHPTAAYEIVGVGVLALLVYRGPLPRRLRARQGDRFRAFLAGYCLLRLGLECLKPPYGPVAAGELTPQFLGPLTAIQWACVAGLAYYAADIRRWSLQGVQLA
jgi:prolipoprotein diacylglyceryltransferase